MEPTLTHYSDKSRDEDDYDVTCKIVSDIHSRGTKSIIDCSNVVGLGKMLEPSGLVDNAPG